MKFNHKFLVALVPAILATSVQANGQNVALAGFWQASSGLDSSFGNGGKSVFPFPGVASGVAVDSQGRIVVVGTGTDPIPQVVLARFHPDGKSFDGSFGNNGVVVTNFQGGATGRAVAIASQDHIVVAGETNGFLNVALFDQNGTPPQVWPICQATGPADWRGEAYALAIDTSGRIVATGTQSWGALGDQDFFVVARFLPDGCADPNFAGGRGIDTTDASFGKDQTWQAGMAVTIDASGRILVAGPTFWHTKEAQNGTCMTVIRYSGNGFLDTPQFAGSGIACAQIDGHLGSPFNPQEETDAIVLAGSAIWVSGTFGGQFQLAQFDFDGYANLPKGTSVGAGSAAVAKAMILSPYNVLVAGGSAGANEFAMVEYDLNGNLVKGFGNAGIEKLDANCAMSNSIAGLANQWVGGWFGYYRTIAAGPSGPNACP